MYITSTYTIQVMSGTTLSFGIIPDLKEATMPFGNYAESFFPWVSTWRFIEFRTNFQTPRNGIIQNQECSLRRLVSSIDIVFLMCLAPRIGAGGKPKMKLIFSNSSGFALVQKKHLGTDRLIHFQEIHSNETLTDSSPHEVFVWCGIGWGWKYENQICWKFFTSDSFKCHYKQLFGSMFDGWFSCWAIFGGGFTYVFCSCSYPCFEECSSYPIGFGIFTFTININHPSRLLGEYTSPIDGEKKGWPVWSKSDLSFSER